MADISSNTPKTAVGSVVVSTTTLTGADTLTYSNSNQTLYVYNDTGAEVTVNIDGDESSTLSVVGLGSTVDVSGGFDLVVADGTFGAVNLKKISAFLDGTINVTGGTGAIAFISE